MNSLNESSCWRTKPFSSKNDEITTHASSCATEEKTNVSLANSTRSTPRSRASRRVHTANTTLVKSAKRRTSRARPCARDIATARDASSSCRVPARHDGDLSTHLPNLFLLVLVARVHVRVFDFIVHAHDDCAPCTCGCACSRCTRARECGRGSRFWDVWRHHVV
jgi:hypothetical protein